MSKKLQKNYVIEINKLKHICETFENIKIYL